MIQLDENFSINRDPYCFTLNYRKEGGINPKTGKPKVTQSETYHATIQQALDSYVNKKLLVGEEIFPTCDAIIIKLDEINQTIKSIKLNK